MHVFIKKAFIEIFLKTFNVFDRFEYFLFYNKLEIKKKLVVC